MAASWVWWVLCRPCTLCVSKQLTKPVSFPNRDTQSGKRFGSIFFLKCHSILPKSLLSPSGYECKSNTMTSEGVLLNSCSLISPFSRCCSCDFATTNMNSLKSHMRRHPQEHQAVQLLEQYRWENPAHRGVIRAPAGPPRWEWRAQRSWGYQSLCGAPAACEHFVSHGPSSLWRNGLLLAGEKVMGSKYSLCHP